MAPPYVGKGEGFPVLATPPFGQAQERCDLPSTPQNIPCPGMHSAQRPQLVAGKSCRTEMPLSRAPPPAAAAAACSTLLGILPAKR